MPYEAERKVFLRVLDVRDGIGIYVRPETNMLAPEQVIDAMRTVRASTMISFTREDRGVAAACRLLGMTYRHFPVPNSTAPNMVNIATALTMTIRFLENKQTVVLVDQKGLNQSVLIGVLALAHHFRISASDLLDKLRTESPKVKIVSNPIFEQLIRTDR